MLNNFASSGFCLFNVGGQLLQLVQNCGSINIYERPNLLSTFYTNVLPIICEANRSPAALRLQEFYFELSDDVELTAGLMAPMAWLIKLDTAPQPKF